MSATVVSGFSPVVPGGPAGGAAAAAGPGDTSVLDMFGGLLAALLPGGEDAAAEAIKSALTDTPGPTAAMLTGTATPAGAGDAAGTEVPDAAASLLRNLVDALAALDAALRNGQPIDPALRQRLNETLDALAAHLGLQLPAAAALPLAELAELVPAAAGSAAQPSGPAPAAEQPANAAAATTTPPPGTPAAATDAETPAPPPAVAGLVDKLRALGTGVEAEAPQLAGRLRALAQALGSGAVTPQQLAALGLGLDPDATPATSDLRRAVDALLAPAPQTKPVPAAPSFAAASLALPDIATPARGGSALSTRPAAETAAADTPEPEFEPQTANRPAERQAASGDNGPARGNTAAPSAATNAQPGTGVDTSAPVPGAATATTVTAAAAGTRAAHAAYQAPLQQLNMPQIAFEVVRQFQAGNSRFQIRLDPPDLGRIDVRMDMDRDGNVVARMTVERSETLDLMQRDQRSLEKALAQAGLDGGKTNLEFSLRQQQAGRDQRQGGGGQPEFAGDGEAAPDTEEAAPVPAMIRYRGSAAPGGLNLFV